MGTVRLRDIQQGARGTCALLAAAPDNLLFRRTRDRVAFAFHDRLTGQQEWVSVKATGWRSAPWRTTEIIEAAYTKWFSREGYSDETGATGRAAVDNGNDLAEVHRDLTGVVPDRVWGTWDNLQPGNLLAKIAPLSGNADTRTDLPNAHAYRVLGSTADSVTLFNPWRSDGYWSRDTVDDGYVTLSRQDHTWSSWVAYRT
jgi:hypothetical protein